MKKLVFVAAALFVFVSFAHAQNFKWGVQAGMNMGEISGGSDYFTSSHSLGFQGGPYLQYQFSDLIGIQPELLFNEMNAKTVQSFGSVTFKNDGGTIYLNYLSLPVLVRFNLSKAFSLQVGPHFDLLLQNEPCNNGVTDNYINAFKKGDIGGVFAAQFDLGDWLVYGRFNMGFINVSNCTAVSKWHTEEFQLGLGYDLSHLLKHSNSK